MTIINPKVSFNNFITISKYVQLLSIGDSSLLHSRRGRPKFKKKTSAKEQKPRCLDGQVYDGAHFIGFPKHSLPY